VTNQLDYDGLQTVHVNTMGLEPTAHHLRAGCDRPAHFFTSNRGTRRPLCGLFGMIGFQQAYSSPFFVVYHPKVVGQSRECSAFIVRFETTREPKKGDTNLNLMHSSNTCSSNTPLGPLPPPPPHFGPGARRFPVTNMEMSKSDACGHNTPKYLSVP
jgi:hypothetical protein